MGGDIDMGTIKFVKASVSSFNKIRKDQDTLYAVNDTGDFSEASLDDDFDIYIGSKHLTKPLLNTESVSLSTYCISLNNVVTLTSANRFYNVLKVGLKASGVYLINATIYIRNASNNTSQTNYAARLQCTDTSKASTVASVLHRSIQHTSLTLSAIATLTSNNGIISLDAMSSLAGGIVQGFESYSGDGVLATKIDTVKIG